MSDKGTELKGGHLPAVKAGKMRITQHKSSKHEKETNDLLTEENSILKVSTSPPKCHLISGAVMRGHADFNVEAVQSFHEKPKPTVEPARPSVKTIIHQPRK